MQTNWIVDLLGILLASRLLAAAILGFHIATTEGFLLFPLFRWLEDHVPEQIQRPFWACAVCMASVYGTVAAIGLASQWVVISPVVAWLLLVCATAGWNVLPSLTLANHGE
jgi:hypothetical protein